MEKHAVRNTQEFRQALAQGINPRNVVIDRPDPAHDATMAERQRCREIVGMVGMDTTEKIETCGQMIASGKSEAAIGLEMFQEMKAGATNAGEEDAVSAIGAGWK